MANLILLILGVSLLFWLILAQQLLTRLNTRYFISEDEITTAYTRYDRNRHRPTNWMVLAFFHFLSVVSLSFFISMMVTVMFGLFISFIYVFFGTLVISLPLCFFGLHLGALEKTESPLRLFSPKKSTQSVLSIYLILFSAFSIITFSLILVNLLPAAEVVVKTAEIGISKDEALRIGQKHIVEVIMGISILFLILEGWTRISESSFSLLGIVLLIGALVCGIFFHQNTLGANLAIYTQYLVLASILLVIVAYTKLSSNTQRVAFLLLSCSVIAFIVILAIQAFIIIDNPIDESQELVYLLSWEKIYEIRVFENWDYWILLFLPVVLIPSVSSGFLSIISWQSTAKQIRFDSDISRVSYLSTFLLVSVHLIALAFTFSMRNIIQTNGDLSLFQKFLPMVLETEFDTIRSLIYIAVIYMAFLVVAPAFRLVEASLKTFSTNRVVKGILYLLIGGGIFLVLSQYLLIEEKDFLIFYQSISKDVFLFFVLFGSASAGVSAIYMSLASSYFKSEEWRGRLLTLIVLLLFVSSITGFLLISLNVIPSEFSHTMSFQLVTSRFLLFILAVIACLLEIILVIRILTRRWQDPRPIYEATQAKEDHFDRSPVHPPETGVTEIEEQNNAKIEEQKRTKKRKTKKKN